VRNNKAVKQFCVELATLQGEIALYPKGFSEYLFELSYPRYRKDLEAIRPGLEDLGLYEIVLEALSQSETLARSGKFDEAEDLVLEANRKLTDASGHSDDLRRMYKASTDES